jgi:glycosyltransferase involved in cell wall biosynthesis
VPLHFDNEGSFLKVAVVHVSLNSTGGGERVCLSVIGALHNLGCEVTLVTADRTDWGKIRRIFDEETMPDHEFYVFPRLPTTSSNAINSALLVTIFISELFLVKLFSRGNLTVNTCGEKVDSIANIVYVNGIPARCAFLRETDGKRKNIGILYNLFMKAFDRLKSDSIIVNSEFHRELFERCTRKKVVTVYPPVRVDKFRRLASMRRDRNLVVTCSQYVEAQNLGSVPKIAKLVDDGSFVVIGPGSSASKETIDKIQRSIAGLSLEDRVTLLTNQPFSKLFELLSVAKVFLRTLHNEPFGISIVEAMAAGCVPVVPRDGGPWLDILDSSQGKYGYSYATLDEAADCIRILLQNDQLRNEVSKRAQKRAENFESSFFEKKIQEVVRAAISARLKRA